MIRDSVVEEVRARADIVAIIGEFVSLRKAGKDYVGLSPFKDERTPSFFVVPAKNFFHDFSSGESGDVFRFLMKHQGMGFVDAVKFVGARCGVEVREERGRRKGDDPWRPYYEASAFANSFFMERLWEWEGGKRARRYLEGRGIGREEGERFRIGYAPDSWDALRTAASRHELNEDILQELGLVKVSEKRDRRYDAFRNRVTFAIESPAGRVLAFGGRILEGGDGPKYLNSPESPVFHKGAVLYGLRWAKGEIRKQGAAIIVEGFMDAVSLAAAGLPGAVAPLGTSLTPEHATLLRQYTGHARILFDSDPAGLRATFRAADTLLAHGIQVSVATLPDGEDPDSVARAGGADALNRYIGQAVDVLERKLAILEERDAFRSIERTRDALDRLLPTLRAARDPGLRDIYIARVAQRTGVRRRTLEAELAEADVPASGPGVPRRPRRMPKPPIPVLGVERQFILLLLKRRELVERAGERVGPSDLEDRAYRVIFEELLDDPELEALPEGTMEEAVARFERLMGDPEVPSPAEKVFADTVFRIENTDRDRRKDAIDAELPTAGEPEKTKLLAEKRKLIVGEGPVDGEESSRSVDWRRSARRAAKESNG